MDSSDEANPGRVDRAVEPSPRRTAWIAVAALIVGIALGWAWPRKSPAGGAPSVKSKDDSPIVARVDDETVSLAQFDARWEEILSPQARRLHEQRGGKTNYLDEVVDELLLAHEATRRGLGERLDIVEAMRVASNHELSRPLLAQEVRDAAFPESELRAYFEAHRGEWETPLRVRIREVVVTSRPGPVPVPAGDDASSTEAARAKAEALHARILAGEDFGELARRHSEGASAANGGDIGWVGAGQFGAAYEEAALALAVGATSPVIQVPDGYVILQATEREEPRQASFEEKRDEIRDVLLQEDAGALTRRYRIFVDDLRRKARVDVVPTLVEAASSPPAR